MSDFSFTATASCQYCGNLLSSSTEQCDECSDEDIHQQVFRRSTDGTPEKIFVEATMAHKWYRLEEEIGPEWIAYEWLGTRATVRSLLEVWDSFEAVPNRAMSYNAPSDVPSES